MDNIISLNMILNLPREIMANSKINEGNILLRKEIYDCFDTKELKKKIERGFLKYQNVTYLYRFPNENNITLTPSCEIKENMFIQHPKDKIGELITSQVDRQIWATDFYYRLIDLSLKLTNQEAIYLVNAFFKSQTEDTICEILSICRNTLRGIKKSCLVKTWIEIKSLIEDEEY